MTRHKSGCCEQAAGCAQAGGIGEGQILTLLGRSHKIIIGCVAVAVVVLLALIAVGVRVAADWSNPFDDEIFTPAAWAAARRPEDRAAMADDLVAHHLPAGMATAAAVSLLGQPDETYDKGWLEQRRYTNEQIYSYYIGGWSLHGLDDAYVSLEFDAAGVLVHCAIRGY